MQKMSENLNNPNQHSMAEKAAAVGMAVVSLAGNNMPGVGHQTRTEMVPVVTHEQVVDEVPADMPAPADTVLTLKPGVDNEYRADFQTTDSDGQSSEKQATAELDKLLGEDDWARVYDIHVTGESSAEDEQPGGGLQSPSEANTNLALQRTLLAAKPIIDVFKAKGIDVGQEVVKTADAAPEKMLQAEGIEDSWSDADLAAAGEFAEQFGYDSVESMVEHHNDGGTPAAVDEFLKPLLENHRGAEITIKLRGDDGQERSILVTSTHDKVTVTEVPRDVSTRDIVNNQVIGHMPEQVESPIVDPIDGNSDKNPRVRTPMVVEIPGVIPRSEVVVDPPNPPRPWERGRKDAAFKDKKRAPQGNGAKPLRFGGGVPYNPTPSNFN